MIQKMSFRQCERVNYVKKRAFENVIFVKSELLKM